MDKIMTIGLSEEQMNFLRNCGLHCEWMFFDYYTLDDDKSNTTFSILKPLT